MVGHPRVVQHEIGGGGQLGVAVARGEEDAQIVERLRLHVHLSKLTFEVDEGVEVLVLFAGEVEDFVLGAVVIHLPLQRVGQRVDLLQLLIDEDLRLHVGGQTRFRRVIDVRRRKGVQEALRPLRQDIRAGHGDDACALHIRRLQGATVLADAHAPGLHADAEVLGGRAFKAGGISGDVVVQAHNEVNAALRHALSKPDFKRRLVVLAGRRVEHDPVPLRVQHEEVNGASRHARREPFYIGLHRNRTEPRHGHLFDAPDKVVIHVVVNLVDGAAHEVI